MSDSLKPGDLAIVIKSMTGKMDGSIVTCISMDGEHSLYGRIWLIENGRPISVVGGDVTRRAHVPEKWLKKIPSDPLPDEEDVFRVEKLDELKV